MQTPSVFRLGLAALALTSLLFSLSGCPEARPPIDRTQANAIPKALFDGEWYFQRTVVDVPYETEFTFIGDQGELERIRWRIEENLLVAVRSYQRITDSDPDVAPDGEYEGSPVAAWPILSHFDIRRDYNATTGEETNVIIENSWDRQWHERDYIRVDWSSQVLSNWNFYAPEVVDVSPLNYAVTDPTHPDAPLWGDEYIEVTSAFLAQPITETDPDFPEDGAIPLCWYFYHFDDCAPAEVKVRNSFMRVDDRDYEPAIWTGVDMELFGYFDVQRWTYDEQYGPTNTGRVRFQSRWDIWEGDHDGRACSVDADCEDVTGSHCDVVNDECTVPYRDREVKEIPFYASPGMHPRFAAVSQEVFDQWNPAFRDTVNGLRFWECLDAGIDEDTCAAEEDPDIEVFVFCPNNPVLEGDPAICGPAGLSPRLGDLRYNFLYSVTNPGRGNPFGFGPAQTDPRTGEIISASAIMYEAPIRAYGAWARDIVQLMNGEIDEEEYVQGETVSDWVSAREAEWASPVQYTEEQAEELARDVQLHHRAALPDLAPPSGPLTPANKARTLRATREALSHLPWLSADGDRSRVRASALVGTEIEDVLMTGEARFAAGQYPSDPVTETTKTRASPLRRVQQDRFRRATKARLHRNRERCVYHRHFVDPSVQGQATELAGVDPEEIRWILMEGLFRGTAAHEFGHTLGLRHNLEGSADPMNYGARYWELRDDGNMAPRYLDPETQAEVDGRIREEQYSSVMDYLSRFNSDAAGAKPYDMAAIKFGYGRLFEVMYDDAQDVPLPDGRWPGEVANELYLYQLLGWPGAVEYDDEGALFMRHYTEFPAMFGDLGNTIDVPQRLMDDYWGIGEWFESPHLYLTYGEGYPAKPYKFCSDEFAGSGLTCIYFDEGADLYEIPTDLGHRYEAWYIFNNFARDQQFFTPDGYAYGIWASYFESMVSLNQWWVLNAQDLYASEGETDDVDGFLSQTNGFGPFTMGVRDTFNVFARTLARPNVGWYTPLEDSDGNVAWEDIWWAEFADEEGLPSMRVGLSEGRYPDTSWDYEQGYFWDDAVERIGYFHDKVLAMESLFDPRTYFLGQDTAADLRGFRVNYASNFYPQLTELVGNLMVGNKAGFSAWEVDDVLTWPDYADADWEAPAGAVPIDPNAGFTIQLHAMVLGLVLLPDTFDSDIINTTRIWLDGSAEAVDTTLPTVTHEDPGSGLTWRAVSFPGPDGEQGIAARMIERANLLQERWELASGAGDDDDSAGDDDDSADADLAAEIAVELDLQRENLNLLRAIHLELGWLDYE